MKQTVAEFFKDREEYLKVPGRAILKGTGADSFDRIRKIYTKKRPCFLECPSMYVYKDEKDHEYTLRKNESKNNISEVDAWKIIQKRKGDSNYYQDVGKIITELNKEKKQREDRRERAVKNPSGYFLKDNPEAIEQYGDIETDYILYNFISYWYRLTGCRGIINTERVFEYISNFSRKNRSSNLKMTLKKFETHIREDGGVVKIS